MTVRLLPALLILVAMIAAPTLAHVLRPTEKIADKGPTIDLEVMIPKQFGEWHYSPDRSVIAVDPKQREALDKLYRQTLSRTYANDAGYRVMLSIAYGGDQSDSLQVHKPEVCYPSQGFHLHSNLLGLLPTAHGSIPVRRLYTTLGSRHEPITYWTTVGDEAVKNGVHKKLLEMKYGLTGAIPDGLLFRVSSIDDKPDAAFASQERFINDLLEAVAPEDRKRLSGLTGS